MVTDRSADDSDARTEEPGAASGPPPAGLREHLPRPGPRPRLRHSATGGVVVEVLLAATAAAGLFAAFTGIGPAQADAAVLGESLEARSGWLTALAVVVTNIGSTVAMAVLAVAAGAWCWYRGHRADAVLVVGAMAGAAVVFRTLKLLLGRERPPEVDRIVGETNESLPSGHATMSVVVIGSLVVLAWAGSSAVARTAVVTAAALWVGAVGATRIYLGVHWFSDVLAGWLVGAAWLALCVTAWSWWRSRQPAETSSPG